MAYNIVLINTLQRKIKRRQARSRHIFRLISLFLPPAARGEFIPMRRGCISHRKFVAAVWDFLTDFTNHFFSAARDMISHRFHRFHRYFLSHRLFRRQWIKRVIISLLRLCDFRNAMLVARKCSCYYPLSLDVGKIKRIFSTKFA